jgi:hypothetical protein
MVTPGVCLVKGGGGKRRKRDSDAPDIRETAERLTAIDEPDFEYVFFCECGCLTQVPLTLAVFATTGALADGHYARP